MVKESIKKNTIYNMIKVVSQIIFPLITFPYISRVLHADAVGTVNYANSIYSYISLIASLSITTYAVRECSIFRENRNELGKTASELFTINLYATFFAYAVMLIVLRIPKFQSIQSIIFIYCVNMIFTTLGADWINTAMEDFQYITFRTVSFQFISLILMFLFVHKPADYVKYVIISVIASSGSNITNIFYRRKYCRIKLVRNPNIRKHLPPILKFFIAVITQQFYVNSDVVMLGWITNTTEVGLYSTASKVFNIINLMIASIFTVVLPQACSSYEEGNYKRYNEILRKVLLFLIGLGLPCAVGMFFLSKEVIILIAGAEYESASTALKVFAFALLFSYIHGFLGNLLAIPMGDYNIGIIAAIISSLTNIVLNAILIPRYGFVAAALTTMIAELISALIFSKKINSNIHITHIGKSLVHSTIGCIFISLFILLMKDIMILSSVNTIILILGSILIYGVVLMIFKDEFFMQGLSLVIGRTKRENR